MSNPATVQTTARRYAGMYRVTLTNGAEATVSRDNACSGDTGTGKWQWDDMQGGTDGHDTKSEAIAQFIDYRG